MTWPPAVLTRSSPLTATDGRSRSQGSPFSPEVRRALPGLIALRMTVTTSSRMVFAYLPAISRGTGLSTTQMGLALSLRDLMGLLAIPVGNRADRFDRWRTILGGALLLGVGFLLASLGAVGVVIGLAIFGLGRLTFQVGYQAWIADEVAFERRGKATGLIEMTWAGANLIGIPIIGVLIDAFGWRAAFVALGSVAVGLTVAQRNRSAASTSGPDHVLPESYDAPPVDRNIVSVLLGPALLTGGAQYVFFGHGTWLEEAYGFSATRIGFAVVALGAAELLASFGSSRLADLFGKKRSVVAGTAVMAAAMVALTVVLAGPTVPPLALGLALLVLAIGAFEFAIVSSIPLVSELHPGGRARFIGWAVATRTLTKAIVALSAGWIDQRYDFRILLLVGVVFTIAALVVVAIGVREPGHPI